jgi:putative PIN family toxin of toxin-antitoxin system
MRRVVFDTNVWVSGLLWNGAPRLLIELALKGQIRVGISPYMQQELFEVLCLPKFGLGELTAHRYVREVEDLCTIVSPITVKVIIAKDPDDDHVLACAVEFDAEIIASGDEHLLALRGHLGVRCLSPAEALARLV